MDQPRKHVGFKRRALVIVLITAAVAGVLVLFGVQSVQRIQAVEDRWVVYNQDATEAGRLLHSISRQMGYGGFIHNFKNFILRRDLQDMATLTNNREAVEADLDKLERFVISQEEKAALEVIRAVFDKYAESVNSAAEAFKRGLSSVEVDILVKVDDGPTQAAIATLNHSFLTRARLAESQINMALKAAANMVWVLLAVVPVVVFLGVVLISFLRRIMVANAKLGEVRDELAILLRQAPDAILHVGGDGAILRANDRAVMLFGYPRDELLEKTIEDLIPQRYQSEHVGIREQSFDQMSSRPIGRGAELYTLTKDGREVPVEISLNFSLSGGKRIATAIVRDVTERKRAQEALKQAHDELEQRVRERTIELEQRTRELEDEIVERRRAESQLVQSAKMATIGEMSSGITHELNQPMNIMRMGVEAAQIRIQRGQADIASLAETLARIEGQILRMSEIVNHMRIYSRQDTEGQAPFDPYQAVREGCQLFAGQLSGLNVDLVVDAPSPSADQGQVLGHAIRLEQVILNLLSNARDAIIDRQARDPEAPAGRIRVHMHEDLERASIYITVDDNGGGIAEDVLPHIFAPFVTTKESGQGTGLGLSISYGIIEGMRGVISVANADEGARFEITLARVDERSLASAVNVDAEKNARPTSARSRIEGGATLAGIDRATILVVDDEASAANSLSDFLQEMGYLVYTAYNGEEAIRIYESDPADAVITDLHMPVMDGWALISKLRELSSTLPIFAMTGHVLEDSETPPPQGATDVWRKPISLSEVAQQLHVACGERSGSQS